MTLDIIHSPELAPEGSVLTITAASQSPKAVLEAQWRRHMIRLTDLSIQLYDNGGDEAADPDESGEPGQADLRASIEAVRREMYAVEDTLDRLAGASYRNGRSEPVSSEHIDHVALTDVRIVQDRAVTRS